MKSLSIRLLLIIASISLAGLCDAKGLSELPVQSYLGFEVQKRNMSIENSSIGALKRRSNQGNMIFGIKINDLFKIETGFSLSKRLIRHDKSAVSKLHGFHLGFVGCYPITNDFSLIGSIGCTLGKTRVENITVKSKPRATLVVPPSRPGSHVVPAYDDSMDTSGITLSRSLYSSTKLIPRFLIGVEYKINDSFYIRSSIIFEDTNRVRQDGFTNRSSTTCSFGLHMIL